MKMRTVVIGLKTTKNTKSKNADLVKKIENLEMERTHQIQSLLATKKENLDLKEKLKLSEIDENNMIQLKEERNELENYVEECERRMEDSSEYYLATIEDLEQQLEQSRRLKDVTLFEGYKKNITEKDCLIASLERKIYIQEKKLKSLLEELDDLRRSIGKRPRIMQNNENLLKDIETERATNISQANQISEMKRKIIKLNEEISKKSNEMSRVSKEEIDRIRKDLAKEAKKNNELSNEIISLKETMRTLSEKEQRSTNLSMEIEVIRSNLNMKTKLNDALETEVAQLKESIQDLQRDVNQHESNNADSTSKILLEIEKEKAINLSLQNKLQDFQSQKDLNLENDQVIQKLENDVKIEKAKNEKLRDTIECLKGNILPLEKDNDHLLELSNAENDVEIEKATNEALAKALSETRERANRLEDELSKFTTYRKEVETEREKLQDDLKKANKRIVELERGAHIILDLQSIMTDIDVFDGKFQNAFDELIATVRLEKDDEIDSLRKNLAESQRPRLGVESELKSKLEESEKSVTRVKEDYEKKIQRKNFKISSLEENAASREQTMSYMRSEMDQLQSSMQKIVLEKRAEIEELQQELMDTQNKSKKKERDRSSMKMKLEEFELKYKDETAKLRNKIAVLEAESPFQRNIQVQRDDKRIEDLTNEIHQLTWRNTNLAGKNEILAEKLSNYEGSQKVSKNDKWRNTALREEVEALKKKIMELQNSGSNSVSRPSPERSIVLRGGVSTMTKYAY